MNENEKELFSVETHFSTSDNKYIVCTGKTLHSNSFLLVITIKDKPFPRKWYNTQSEAHAITKYRDQHYKIEVILFREDNQAGILHLQKYFYKEIYKKYIDGNIVIKTNDALEFHYKSYNIPCNVWLISTGYIVGIV